MNECELSEEGIAKLKQILINKSEPTEFMKEFRKNLIKRLDDKISNPDDKDLKKLFKSIL